MKTDLQLDDNLELVEDANTHDFVEGISDEQHMQLLILTKKGAWKESPDTGAGIENYLNDDDIDGMLREVRRQFENDGIEVSSIDFDEEQMKLLFDAQYKN